MAVRLDDVGTDVIGAAVEAKPCDDVLEIGEALRGAGQPGAIGIAGREFKRRGVEIGVEIEGGAEEGVQPLAFLRPAGAGEASGRKVKVTCVLALELVQDCRVVARLARLGRDARAGNRLVVPLRECRERDGERQQGHAHDRDQQQLGGDAPLVHVNRQQSPAGPGVPGPPTS